ncbi:type 12 methyltransferase [Nitratireductor indicus C115]|uniref:Type 12 methyltransferase n=1 Tax=Nitratireductor indicus C115 TaxID=1231190 RepID=K2P1Q0_9HYPH|nr:glycosyltransferase [Nitratireductor indicus]EKF41301.1 type 12 methyltransferase [Nitratireductor indicus C115]SFQ65630.1 Glycosyltransferase involved in cell wall bisynthesis [Nitratireductor indicus]
MLPESGLETVQTELKRLQDENRRLRESASFRLGHLLVSAAQSPRRMLSLPVDLVRLVAELRRGKAFSEWVPRQCAMVREQWHSLACDLRLRNDGAFVFLFSGTTFIQGTRGNRPIRQAQALLGRKVPVLFSYHRSRPLDDLPVSANPSLIQSPVDVTMQLMEEFATEDLGALRKLFIVSYPYPGIERYIALFRSNGWKIIYDCRDDWEEFAKVGMARWFDAEVESRLVAQVDRTYCVSTPLVAKMQRLAPGSQVALMPNAVETDFLPPDYRHEPQSSPPIVGYFGHLSSAWFNWDAFEEIARRLPQYRFEIIGHSAPEDRNLPPNVELLGPKPWQELHRYARRWSAAIIPFRIGALSDGVDPIKIYEYLSFGLPVVSFRMPQIRNYPYTVTVETVDAFCNALERACGTVVERGVIDAFLARNTWEVRAEELLQILDDKMGR